jgi:uncharacterized membrane protein YhaH (DUF805 family)
VDSRHSIHYFYVFLKNPIYCLVANISGGGCALWNPENFVFIVIWLAFYMTRGHGSLGNQAFGGLLLGLPSLVHIYFGSLYLLLCLYPLYRLVGKRCRDRNRPAWLSNLYTAALFVSTAVLAERALLIILVGFLNHDAAASLENGILLVIIACLAVIVLVDLVVLRGHGQAAEPSSPITGPPSDN